MPGPLAIFRGTNNRDISAAVGFSSYASPAVVFNTNALVGQDYPLDPHRILAGSDTYGKNVRPVVVPSNYFYLNLFPAWTGGVNDALSTAPVVHVYGLLPAYGAHRAYPHDANSNFPDFSNLSGAGGNFWIPMLPEGGASGSGVTLNNGVDMNTLLGGKRMMCSKPTTFYLAGVRRIIVAVETAAAVSGDSSSSSGGDNEVEAALIAGWFSG